MVSKEINIRLRWHFGNEILELLEGTVLDDNWLEFMDGFGRKWKLVPIKNENIKSPFVIIPLS